MGRSARIDLMWSVDTPEFPEATSYIEGALTISGAAVLSASAVGAYEIVALGNQSINVVLKGGEIVLDVGGRSFFRLNPLGDPSSANPYGRRPHYHRRPINRPANPGEGIGRHRPWE